MQLNSVPWFASISGIVAFGVVVMSGIAGEMPIYSEKLVQ